jgi:hypothetical protein
MSTAEESLRAADRARRVGMISADVELLAGILDDGLLWIHASGATDTKRSLLTSIESGRLDYQSIEPADEVVRWYAQTALITGLIALNVVIDGVQRDVRNIFTSVWQHASIGWQLVNWQTTAARPTGGQTTPAVGPTRC